MQLDPIEPTLKPPGTKRLKLKYEKLVSSFGFNFNLRRYTKELLAAAGDGKGEEEAAASALLAGAYTRPHLCST